MRPDNAHTLTMASDLDRDGVALELMDKEGEVLAEVFYSDVEHTMTLTTYRQNISLELIEWLIERARERLPPQL